MTSGSVAGLTLDTGALLALDEPVAMKARIAEAWRRGGTVCIPAEAVAQAWRSPRQAQLARLLKSRDIEVATMSPGVARSVGLICARTGHDDIVKVHVVFCARPRNHAIVTSDPGDVARLDSQAPKIVV